MRSDGLDVAVSLYTSAFTGYRWEEFEWGWSTAAGYQRVDLVVSSSPAGNGLVFPTLHPEVVLDALRTSTDFVANRQVDCGVLPVPPRETGATLEAFLAAAGTRSTCWGTPSRTARTSAGSASSPTTPSPPSRPGRRRSTSPSTASSARVPR